MSHSAVRTDSKQRIRRTSESTKANPIEDIATVTSEVERPILFEERTLLKTHSFEYERDRPDPGTVLIFHHEEYQTNIEFRKGSRRDVNEIVLCFQRLGYNIFPENIHKDFKVEEILKKLKEVAESKELFHTNSLIVFFLTHGHQNDLIHAQDNTFKVDKIWRQFTDCEALEGKPKIFIFQACKGDDNAAIDKVQKPENLKLIPDSYLSTYNLPADMLIFFSTIEGNVSFRSEFAGSWFIQELCKNFSTYGRRDDLISLLFRTTKCVCNNYIYVVEKQMPVFVSTLRKKFYLNRNKDRHWTMQVMDNDDALVAKLKEINRKLDAMDKKKV